MISGDHWEMTPCGCADLRPEGGLGQGEAEDVSEVRKATPVLLGEQSDMYLQDVGSQSRRL